MLRPAILRFIRDFWLFAVLVFLASCGPDTVSRIQEADATVTGVYSANAKVALGEENPGAIDEFRVMGSWNASDSTIQSAAFCKLNGTQCADGEEYATTLVKTTSQYKIVRTEAWVRIEESASYALVLKTNVDQTFVKIQFQPSGGQNSVPNGQEVWRAVLATGDNEFRAWDNARDKLATMFTERGVKTIKHLSMTQSLQTNGVAATSKQNIQSALSAIASESAADDRCLVFMTSHGSRQGFFLRNKGTISPGEFEQYLDQTCGDRPTVAIISACYSGVMITDSIKKPNRIIFTAASRDKTSFGCDARSTYTFFDQCVIESLPKAQTWKNFGEINTKCVKDLEQARNMPHFSNPQTYIGNGVESLRIPGSIQ